MFMVFSCLLVFCCSSIFSCSLFFFFFNDTATTEIYTLSLHDALPICWVGPPLIAMSPCPACSACRSEEHTSELQSRPHLVCRLLLEKKKKNELVILIKNKKKNKIKKKNNNTKI